MAVKPILFNTDMVLAIPDGRKTVTRRVVKPQPIHNEGFWEIYGAGWSDNIKKIYPMYGHSLYTHAPYHPGDILYVRETWQYMYDLDGNDQIIEDTGRYVYAADGFDVDTWVNPDGTHRFGIPWRPSIHMPKEAARIWLKVISVRAEHLQKITEEEAKAEGVNWKNGKHVGWEEKMKRTAIERFAELWNSSIERKNLKTYGWEENPWVWRIEFKLCDMPEEVIKERLQRGRLERLIENRGIGKTIRAIPLNFACARIIEELNKKEDFYNAFRDGIINSIKDPDTMSYPEPEDIADKIISRIMGE